MNLWHDIIESLPEAIVVLSRERQPVAFNPAAETMLGASTIGRLQIVDLLDHNPWLERMVRTALESGQTVGDPDAVLALGPRSVTVRAEVSPLLGADARPDSAIIMLHDLSHQKNAAAAAESGESSMRLSPAGLAHEVKNPLTGIKGAAELLATMYPGDARAQQYCGVILDGVDRIAALVEQVLAVSAPQRLAHEPVNIHQVIHEAMRMAGMFPNPPEGVAVEQDFDPSLPPVIGDAAALERALLNLIKNAVEAIGPSGAVRLHTRMETEFRMASEGRRLQFLRIDIADSGPGMSEQEIGQLFTPFYTTKPAGTGLGLVLSQRIIALHGGRLWAIRGGLGHPTQRGEPPVGMTFRITLPVSADTHGRG